MTLIHNYRFFQALMPLRNNVTSSPPLLSDHSFHLKSLSKFRRPYLFPINRLGCGPIAEKSCSSIRIRPWTISRSSNSFSGNWATAGFWTSEAWSQLFPHRLVGHWQPRDGNRHMPRIHCLAKVHFDCGRGYERPFALDQSSPSSSSEGLTTRFSSCSSPGENDKRGECIIRGEGRGGGYWGR